MIARRLALLSATMLVAGVCHAGLFSDDEARDQIAELRKQNAALQDQAKAMDARLTGVEGAQRNLGMGAVTELDAIKAELDKLRGQIEVQTHDIETTQKRQKDLYVDLDARLRQLEQRAAAPEEPAKPGKDRKAAGKAAAAPAPVPAAPADPVAEGKAYDAAFNRFKLGDYAGALGGFESFVQAYPNSPLAPGAQYWIGNSQFNLRDFKSAISSQETLLSRYPKSPKVPDAMLNIATSQQNLGDTDGAKKTLEDLLAKFPVSEAADKAKKRLDTMQ